jgi:hypothetical protein
MTPEQNEIDLSRHLGEQGRSILEHQRRGEGPWTLRAPTSQGTTI